MGEIDRDAMCRRCGHLGVWHWSEEFQRTRHKRPCEGVMIASLRTPGQAVSFETSRCERDCPGFEAEPTGGRPVRGRRP